MKKLFSEENKVPRMLLGARKVAESATNRVEQYEIVLSLRSVVCLFSLFIRKNKREFDCLVYLSIQGLLFSSECLSQIYRVQL